MSGSLTDTAASAPAPAHTPWWRTAWAAAVAYKGWILSLLGFVAVYALLRRVPIPRPRGSRALMIRLVVYGALGIVLMPWVLSFVRFLRSTTPEQWSQAQQQTRQAIHAATTPTRLPCDLIGLWSSTNGGVMRRIELRDDGRYVMAASMLGIDPRGGYAGQWWVQEGNIVWLDDSNGIVDTNQMLNVADGRFEVIENNGRRTRFERIEAKASSRCDSAP
jgi:hypothetical protein